MTRTITLNLAPGAALTADPVLGVNDGVRHISGFIPAHLLPPGLPDDPNARVANLRARNATAIRDSLLRNDGKFHLKNKGITILASDAVPLGEGSFALTLAPHSDGIVDGGHTYAVVQAEVAAGAVVDRQFVPVFVRVGCAQDDLPGICEGLNTSVQVSTAGLMARTGLHAWLEDELESGSIPARVSWRDNEPGEVSVEHVVRILAVANPGAFPSGHPVMALTSPGALMARYREFHSSFVAMSPIACEILRMFDRISTDLVVELHRAGHHEGHLAAGQRYEFPLFDTQVQTGVARVPITVSLPVVAGIRAWVVQNVNGAYLFDRPVSAVADDLRAMYPRIAEVVWEFWSKHGGHVADLGRDSDYWSELYALFSASRLGPAPTSRFDVSSPKYQRRRDHFIGLMNQARYQAESLSGDSFIPEQDLARLRAERAASGLADIVALLERGTFGVCITCYSDVEIDRLEHWASAERCRRCALSR